MLAGFEDVEAHGVFRRVVKDQAKEIKLQDGMETLGEFVEKRLKVVLWPSLR